MKSQKFFKIPLLSNSAVLHQYTKRSYDLVNGVGRSGLTNMKDTYVMIISCYELAIPSIINPFLPRLFLAISSSSATCFKFT